jgi:glutathione synthase
MTSRFSFAEWPPVVTDGQLETLTLYATTYALSHGLLYLPATTPQPSVPTSAIHAPLSIFPSPLPRRLFDRAQKLQKLYNILYARIAMDHSFLDRVMGGVEGVGKVDDFVGTMWRGWKGLRDENGVVQVSYLLRKCLMLLIMEDKPRQLGLFRSDYLLHAPSANSSVSLKQVEFNTISSSFGPLSERATGLHRLACCFFGRWLILTKTIGIYMR